MVAIFALSCCERQIVFGRYRGDDMYPPTLAKCRFGCQPKLDPRGRPDRIKLRFVCYQSEELVSDELFSTWLFPDRSGNLWHKYHKVWQAEKEASEKENLKGTGLCA